MKTLYCVEFQRGTTTERITVRAASHAQAYRIALALAGVTGEPDATITPEGQPCRTF